MENFCIYTEIGIILKTWTELGGRKGLVSYGPRADISLPPCQIGDRLVSETAAHSRSDPRDENSWVLLWYAALVPRLEVLLRGSSIFRFPVSKLLAFEKAQLFRTRVLTIIRGKTYQRELRKQPRRPQGPRSLQHGGRMKAEWYPGYENWAKDTQKNNFL